MFGPGPFNFGNSNGQSAQSQAQRPGLFSAGNTSTSNSPFGNQQTNAFGSGTQNNGFGTGGTTGQSTLFGQSQPNFFGTSSTTSATPTFNLFGQSSAQPQSAGTHVPFSPTEGSDTVMKGSVATQVKVRYQAITFQKEYENKSLEELRLEDYQLNRKGPQQKQAGLFGATSTTPQTTQPQGIFSGFGTASNSSATTGTSFFGQGTGTNSLFGQGSGTNSLFGQGSGTNSLFGQNTGGGLFNTSTPPTTTTSFFGTGLSTPTTTSASTPAFGNANTSFGNTSTVAPQTGIFGLSTPAPLSLSQPQGGSFFNKSAAAAAPATPGFSLFGGSTSTTSASTTASAAKPTWTLGTTGSIVTPATSAAAAPTFSFGSSFPSSSQQAKPTPFAFGSNLAPAKPAFQSQGNSGVISGVNTAPFQPVASGPISALGNTPIGNKPGFIQATGFSPGLFSMATPQQVDQIQRQRFQQQLNQPSVSFATSPFKDNPLFYNLISQRSVDEMSKPTNPETLKRLQEASRKKPSAGATSASTPLDRSAKSSKPDQKNYQEIKPVRNLRLPFQINHGAKAKLFDGFEDDDMGLSGTLAPEKSKRNSDWKKLTIKPDPGTPTKGSKCHTNEAESQCPKNLMMQATMVLDETFKQERRVRFSSPLVNANAESRRKCDESGGGGDNSTSPDESPKKKSRDSFDKENRAQSAEWVDGAGTGCGVTCTRAGYYVIPSLEELDQAVDAEGNCIVQGFEVGRRNFGSIKWVEPVNVKGLNVDQTIDFAHKTVIVFPNDNDKPPPGQGINLPAQIQLERVFPIDKTINEMVRSPEKVIELNYEGKLKRACERLEAEFVSYDPYQGRWIFNVEHFSSYSCNAEDNLD